VRSQTEAADHPAAWLPLCQLHNTQAYGRDSGPRFRQLLTHRVELTDGEPLVRSEPHLLDLSRRVQQ
jgi:hypothetical protein